MMAGVAGVTVAPVGMFEGPVSKVFWTLEACLHFFFVTSQDEAPAQTLLIPRCL